MTFRVLGPHEQGRFESEAWGQLMALAAAGALNPMELERVIERALAEHDGRVTVEELRALLERAGLRLPESGETTTVH